MVELVSGGDRERQGRDTGAAGMVSILIGTAGEGAATLRGGAGSRIYIMPHPKPFHSKSILFWCG